MNYKEEDLVLCVVEKIEDGVVLVKTLKEGVKGTITYPEVAPGRIKNIREYVVPNKIIVCKVLKVFPHNLVLSLRRVSLKERKEILEDYKREKDYENALKSILKEKATEIIEKIKTNFNNLKEFFQKADQDRKIIGDYVPKEFQKDVEKVIAKKKRKIDIKRIINLVCLSGDGIEKIKEILDIKKENVSVKYLAAGRYLLTITSEDFKKAEAVLRQLETELEKNAKKYGCEFSISEK